MPSHNNTPPRAAVSPEKQENISNPVVPDSRRRIEPLVVLREGAVQHPISLDSISATLQTLGKHASTGLSSLSSVAASTRAALNQQHGGANPTSAHESLVAHHDVRSPNSPPPLGSSPSPIFGAMGGETQSRVHEDVFNSNAAVAATSPSPHLHTSTVEPISWTAWDSLAGKDALVLAHPSGGLQIYTRAAERGADNLIEVLNFQHLLLPGDRVAGRVLCAKIIDGEGVPPYLLVVTRTPNASTLTLSSCGFDSQFITKTTVLAGVGSVDENEQHFLDKMQASVHLTNRHLVIAQSSPPAIHILDSQTWQPVQPALTDVATSSLTRQSPPTCHLSGRMLAYASTSTPASTSNVISTMASTHPHAPHPRPPITAIETGAQASEMAKKVSQGVKTGFKTMSDWGATTLATYGYNAEARGGTAAAPASPMTTAQHQRPHGASPPAASTVRILDLKDGSKAAAPSTPACFRPIALSTHDAHAHNIACVRLSPDGTMVFVSDSAGHTFNIYELRPRPRLAADPVNDDGTDADAAVASTPVYHRFKLLRGVTAAHVCDAQWSKNARWIGVMTATGTVHIYHIERTTPHAIGTTLTAFTRTPRPALEAKQVGSEVDESTAAATSHEPSLSSAFPAFIFVDKAASASASAARNRVPSPSNSPPLVPTSTLAASPDGLDVLCAHPQSAKVTLNRAVVATHSLRDSIASSAGAASSRVSGLTAMMRRASTASGQGNLPSTSTSTSPPPSAASPSRAAPRDKRLVGACLPVAIWSGLARSQDAPEVRPEAVTTATKAAAGSTSRSARAAPPSRGWVSLAEIQTYDRTPRALPTSIYLAHQFRFHAYSANAPLRLEPIYFDVPTSRKSLARLHTRRAVRVRSGSGDFDDNDDDGEEEGAERIGSPRSFDARLAGAIHARGFDTADIYGSSPSSRIPMFPQGQPARKPSWRSSVTQRVNIPIRSAVGAAAVGRGVVQGIRKTSGGSVGSSSLEHVTSLSFDEDISHDKFIFEDARNATPSPNGYEGHSGSAGRRQSSHSSTSKSPLAGLSPFEETRRRRSSGHALGGDRGVSVGSTSGGSAETPPSDIEDVDDDDDEEPEEDMAAWTAARGMQEDVEGDQLGWDSFADPEFAAAAAAAAAAARKGAVAARGAAGKSSSQRKREEEDREASGDGDFLVGGLTLEGVEGESGAAAAAAEKVGHGTAKAAAATPAAAVPAKKAAAARSSAVNSKTTSTASSLSASSSASTPTTKKSSSAATLPAVSIATAPTLAPTSQPQPQPQLPPFARKTSSSVTSSGELNSTGSSSATRLSATSSSAATSSSTPKSLPTGRSTHLSAGSGSPLGAASRSTAASAGTSPLPSHSASSLGTNKPSLAGVKPRKG